MKRMGLAADARLLLFTIAMGAMACVQAQAQVATNNYSTAAPLPALLKSANRDFRVWERDEVATNARTNERRTIRRHELVELGSGMNYWDAGAQQWTPSNPSFQESADGSGFTAAHVAHPVRLASNLNTAPAVSMQTPDGALLESSPLAIVLYDSASGRQLVVAVVTNCSGYQVASNVVVFDHAFDRVCASVVYTLEKGSFHQDIVFTGRFDVRDWSFPTNSTRVQIWTELYSHPTPDVVERPLYVENNATVRETMVSPDLIDNQIGFGDLVLGTGRAYVADAGTVTNQHPVFVAKELVNLDQRTFLVESLVYAGVQKALAALSVCEPPAGTAAISHPNSSLASAGIKLPSPPRRSLARLAAAETKSLSSPTMTGRRRPAGLYIDYVATVSGTINTPKIFQADATYAVTAPYYCNSSVTIEGGTVFKYPKQPVSAFIELNGPITCATAPYRPAVCTAGDDDSVGDSMSGVQGMGYQSGGVPPGAYYGNPAIVCMVGGATLSNLRFTYCAEGVQCLVAPNTTTTLSHCQLINCISGIETANVNDGCGCGCSTRLLVVNNTLFGHVNYPITVDDPRVPNGSLYNCTFDHASAIIWSKDDLGCGCAAYWNFYNSIFAYSSLLASGCATPIVGGDHNGFANNGFSAFGSPNKSTASSPFLTADGGNYYLAEASFRGFGKTAIDPGLLKALQAKTTQPPIIYASTAVPLNLSPQVQRDPGISGVDIGFHYDALDYAFSDCTANGNVTVAAGTAAGWSVSSSGFGAISFANSAVAFNGTQPAPDCWVRLHTVQEQDISPEPSIGAGLSGEGSVVARFTTFSSFPGDLPSARGDISFQLAANDCEFHGGTLGLPESVESLNLTNCLLNRVNISVGCSCYAPVNLVNCTMIGGQLSAEYYGMGIPLEITLRDSAFDQTSFSFDLNSAPNSVDIAYSAFSGSDPAPPGQGAGDLSNLGSFGWTTGPLGGFYLPAGSALVDHGSRMAAYAGLYCFTTQASPPANTDTQTVDIGYHYAAVDQNGVALDSDGNGLPDWWEMQYFGQTGVDPNADPDGDGLSNAEEYWIGSDPTDPDTGNTGISDGMKDSDQDGLSNLSELRTYFTDPADAHSVTSQATDGEYITTARAGVDVTGTKLDLTDQGGAVQLNISYAPKLSVWDLYFVNTITAARWQWRRVYSGIQCDNAGQAMFQIDKPDPNQGYFVILLAQDSDGDGLTDGYECWFRYNGLPTNATNPKSNGGNIEDGWAVEYGLDPTSNTSPNGDSGDQDNDGNNNLQEYNNYYASGQTTFDGSWDPLEPYSGSTCLACRPVITVSSSSANTSSRTASFTFTRSYGAGVDPANQPRLLVYYAVGGTLRYGASYDYTLDPQPQTAAGDPDDPDGWPRIFLAAIPAGQSSVTVNVTLNADVSWQQVKTLEVAVTPYGVSRKTQVQDPSQWDYVVDWKHNRASVGFGQGWDGMRYVNTLNANSYHLAPPDVGGAAGPSGVLQTVNLRIKYYNKSGDVIWPADGSDEPLENGLFAVATGSKSLGDAKSIYDPASGRFFAVMEENWIYNPPYYPYQGCQSCPLLSYCNIAVSKSSDPQGPSDWNIYKIDMLETSVDPDGTKHYFGGDYPGLGVDDQCFYVSYNMFRLGAWAPEPTSGGAAVNCQILVFKKSDLTGGVQSPLYKRYYTPFNTAGNQNNGFSIQPATPRGGTYPTTADGSKPVAFFAEIPDLGYSQMDPASVRIWCLTDPLGTGVLTSSNPELPANQNTGGGQAAGHGAPQPSGVLPIDTIEGNRAISAVWLPGSAGTGSSFVWFCATAGGNNNPKAYWFRADVSAYPTVTAIAGKIEPPSGAATYYPTLNADDRGDICVVFTESSATEYPSIAYTWRAASDPVDTLHPETAFRQIDVVKVSANSLQSLDSQNNFQAPRWGDFGSVSPDPATGGFWISHEYVHSADYYDDWGTWWRNIYIP